MFKAQGKFPGSKSKSAHLLISCPVSHAVPRSCALKIGPWEFSWDLNFEISASTSAPLLRKLAVPAFMNITGERTAAPLAIGLFQIHPDKTGPALHRPAVPEQSTEPAGQRAYPLN